MKKINKMRRTALIATIMLLVLAMLSAGCGVTQNGNVIDGSGNNTGEDGNYYYFTMPSNADVTVTAIWTTDAKTLTGVSAEGIVGYWATWFGHARFVLPEGAAAYTMNSEHKLYRLGDDGRTIPAGVAVVIISDKETIALTPDTSTGTTTVTDHAPGGNILRGSNSATTVSGTPYALGVVNGVLGFYEYTGGPVPAHKAYYVQ